MTLRELRVLLDHLPDPDASDYLAVIMDEDDEVYTIIDVTVDEAHEVIIFHTNTTPLDMR